MILALDVGNSQIFGGVFSSKNELLLTFRKTSKYAFSADEFGLFLKQVLRENNIEPMNIQKIGICTVVPDMLYSLKSACVKYFQIHPFVLQAGVKTGLKIKYRNPLDVGADRIANTLAAIGLFPQRNLIIVDYGTATTFCAVNSQKEYLGGVICAGIRISMEALESQTAKLPAVEIVSPQQVVGRSTIESIQSGLYFGHLGLTLEIIEQIQNEVFSGEKAVVIGTGGFAKLFEKSKIFTAIIPELVLQGIMVALKNNT